MIVGNRGTPLLRGTKPIGYESSVIAAPGHLLLEYVLGYTPNIPGTTATRISEGPNIWDIYAPATSWDNLLAEPEGNLNNNYLTAIIDANFINVTSAKGMCKYCARLRRINFSNTFNVTNMSELFRGCGYLNIVNWFDTSKVTDMSYMFFTASSLSSYSLSLVEVPFFDTSNVTTMRGMFYGQGALTSVPLFNTSKVTDMSLMFGTANPGVLFNLTTVPLFDTSNVTTMEGMFTSRRGLISVPLFDTSKVTNMSYMLNECYSLTSIPLFDLTAVTDMDFMCFMTNKVETGALDLYNRAASKVNVPSHTYTFYDCGVDTDTGAAELAQIPSDWKE